MGSNATMNAALRGVAMQVVMVAIGKFVPAIGQIPNFYAVAGTVLAALTGAVFARLSPGATSGQVSTGGAIAGGSSSAIGGLCAVLTGQWPGFQVVQLLFPLISGAIGGAVGGLLGRVMK